MVKKASLSAINQFNDTRVLYIAGETYNDKTEAESLSFFCRPKRRFQSEFVLNIEEREGENIARAEEEARKKHEDNIAKVSAEALQEINQTLAEYGMSIETAEIY